MFKRNFQKVTGTVLSTVVALFVFVVSGFGWGGWESLGTPSGGRLGRSVVARNLDGRLEVFSTNGVNVYHVYQAAPNSGWSGWELLGTAAGRNSVFLTVERNADGRLDLFAIDSLGDVQHISQTRPNSGWGAWQNLGHPSSVNIAATSLAATHNQDGRLELFIVDTNGNLQHIYQTVANGGWSSWQNLGKPTGANLTIPVIGKNYDGRLEVFSLDNAGNVQHIYQTAPNSGWSSWQNLGHPDGQVLTGGLTVGENGDGRLEVFVMDRLGNIFHIYQAAPNSSWGGWQFFIGRSRNITLPLLVGKNADGRLELFAQDSSENLEHIWQLRPNSGWSSLDNLSRPVDRSRFRDYLALGQNQDGRLEIFLTDYETGILWHIYQ